MAKLGVYYGLCPLIDQKSLLGVVEDETEGFVIVTLGKNMAIKYKVFYLIIFKVINLLQFSFIKAFRSKTNT